MNLAKFGAGYETKRMYEHWSRAKDDHGQYITYPREAGGAAHIHRERTAENYTIGVVHPASWIDERLKHVYQKPGQKKPVQSCDIVITLPKTEDPANMETFFNAAYDSLMKLYGQKDNVIGCWVHLDESQPHMHFAFLPIAERKPSKRTRPDCLEKISTAAYWPKKSSLQQMHRTVQKDLDKAMGHHVEVLNGITSAQGGNKTIAQLKSETAKMQERIEKNKVKKERELHDLEGKKTHGAFGLGKESYTLTSAQYDRLRKLAEVSVEQSGEYERMKEKADQLEQENLEYRQKMQRYAKTNKEELEMIYRQQIDQLQKEAAQEKKKASAVQAEAAPYLSIPAALRHVAVKYLEWARQDVCEAVSAVTRRMAAAVLFRHEKPFDVSKRYTAAVQELGMEAGPGPVKQAVKAMKEQIQGKVPKELPSGTWQPKPHQVDYKAPDADQGILSGVLSAQAMVSLHMDEPDEIQSAIEMGDWERVAELMEQRDLGR